MYAVVDDYNTTRVNIYRHTILFIQKSIHARAGIFRTVFCNFNKEIKCTFHHSNFRRGPKLLIILIRSSLIELSAKKISLAASAIRLYINYKAYLIQNKKYTKNFQNANQFVR